MALGDEPAGKFKMGEILEAKAIYEWAEKVGIIERKEKPDRWLCFGEEFDKKNELYARWFLDGKNLAVLRREVLKMLCPKQ